MREVYAAGGLRISADHPLHGLMSSEAMPADIQVHVGKRPAWSPATLVYQSEYTDASGTPLLKVCRSVSGFELCYADGTRFWIASRADEIWFTFEGTIEDACTYLAGPVLAFAFRLRGDLTLHASGVVLGDGALAICGPHGVGKSTTAATLAARGCAILTDDLLRVTDREPDWIAHPFGTIVRLWPEGAELVFGESDHLDPITPTWNKRAVAIGRGGVAGAAATPLEWLAFLRIDGSLNEPVLRTLSPAETAVRLAANSSVAHLLDAAGRAGEFRQVTALARRLPAVEAIRPSSGAPAALAELLFSWTASLAIAKDATDLAADARTHA